MKARRFGMAIASMLAVTLATAGAAIASDHLTFNQNRAINVKAVLLMKGDDRDVTINQAGIANAASIASFGSGGKYAINQTGQSNSALSALLGTRQSAAVNQTFTSGGWPAFATKGRR
ncbi:hypothetical protein [Aquamicrobium zhengzhouense]|uniref:Minor curlin subunit n=1 Tax=Aquamicrobium zhengzhouense TaxID=2781738 RepID=A0ABS0SF49_9HYPH|nr:hypothetical protein [Aquamicrobium zhengzhouense]MBI1621927.1 hypothetical protein [Aquamicrobium zhengzhouense]